MKFKLFWLAFMFLGLNLFAQVKTKNLVIITMDGLRWQELFGGLDTALLNNKKFTSNPDDLKLKFWSKDVNSRRSKLFPFIWGTLSKEGILLGNRNMGSKANVANRYWFSYPGYNEIFTGFPDTLINSNSKVWNRNENVLDFINRQNKYKDKVAVFSSWDCFPFILNSKPNKLFVNSDKDNLPFKDPSLALINEMQNLTTRPLDVRPDIFTYFAAKEYLKIYRPKVLYIALDETDDFAHEGNYTQYIKSAYSQDAMIADLWKWLQSDSEYKGTTTMIITCDHGRGDLQKEEWTSHGREIKGSDEVWIAAMGPDTKAKGEAIPSQPVLQAQLASTFAAILGFNFKPAHPIMEPILELYH